MYYLKISKFLKNKSSLKCSAHFNESAISSDSSTLKLHCHGKFVRFSNVRIHKYYTHVHVFIIAQTLDFGGRFAIAKRWTYTFRIVDMEHFIIFYSLFYSSLNYKVVKMNFIFKFISFLNDLLFRIIYY